MSEHLNPLLEAEPLSLDELFSRDPLGLSDQDIGKIVSELRRQRAKWKLTEDLPKEAKPAKRAAKKVNLNLSLGDLGL